jgi:plastocyanin
MPGTSNPISAEIIGLRARITVLVCALVMSTLVAIGAWKLSPAPAGQTHVVVIEGMKFSPATVRLKAGDRVTFKNNDLVPHTATSTGAKIFDSGMIKAGESWTVTPPPGQTIRYVCTYHPMMEGVIIAEKP